MAKIYRKKTGMVVLSGPVKSIAPDRMSMVLGTQSYNTKETKWVDEEFTVQVSQPLDEMIQVGEPATAAGYQNGQASIMAQAVSAKQAVFNTEEMSVVSGFLKKAQYKDELEADGTPKLKRDGSPRKPHFDLIVIVPEGDRRVMHTIKTYNFTRAGEEDKMSNIDRMKNRFKDFVNEEDTPTYVTIVTQVGQERSWESDYNNKVYENYACDHMGINSLDVEYCYDREQVRTNASQTQAHQEAAQPTPAPVQTQQPTPVPVAPVAQTAPQQAPQAAPTQQAPAPQVAQAQPQRQVYGMTQEPVDDAELPFA